MKGLRISKIRGILAKHGIRKAALFGSFARGEAKKGSDLDLLIAPPSRFTLFDAAGVKGELEAALNVEVDLVTFRSVDKFLAPYIRRDIRMIM